MLCCKLFFPSVDVLFSVSHVFMEEFSVFSSIFLHIWFLLYREDQGLVSRDQGYVYGRIVCPSLISRHMPPFTRAGLECNLNLRPHSKVGDACLVTSQQMPRLCIHSVAV